MLKKLIGWLIIIFLVGLFLYTYRDRIPIYRELRDKVNIWIKKRVGEAVEEYMPRDMDKDSLERLMRERKRGMFDRERRD